jgi:signal transduction histidine kinase
VGAPTSRRRLFVALLFAILGVNLLAIVLFGRVDERLQTEEQERLAFVARTLGLEIARRLPVDVAREDALLDLGERFDRARRFAALETVFLASRDGVVLVEANADGVRLRPRFLSGVESEAARAVWGGAEVFSRAVGEERREGGWLFYPVYALSGEVSYSIGLAAGTEFRERLDRLSPIFLLSRSIGIVLMLLFALFLLLVLQRTLRQIRSNERAGDAAGGGEGADTAFMLNTFHEIVSNLKESQSELKTLYSRAEERASYLEKVVAYMLRTLPTGVVIFDQDRKVMLMNPAARAVLRLPRRDYRGEAAASVFGAGSEMSLLLDELLHQGRPHSRHEITMTGEEGDDVSIGLATSLIHDPAGRVVGGAFLLTDLTETKRLRKRLALKDRLAAMGEMSAGIAHELRNSLATILGYCRLIERSTPSEGASRAYVDKLLAEVKTLGTTSEGLLEFVRPGTRAPASVDVEETLRAAQQAVEERCERGAIAVETRFGATGARVEGDPVALRRAFENLIENAFQAMRGSGTLTLSTRVAVAPAGVEAAHEAAPLLEVIVADSGPGVAPEALPRLFTPFFTTKRGGTGLGLAVVQKTIAEHDGSIDVTSRPEEGTRFRVLLPCRSAVGAGPHLAWGAPESR